MLTKKTKTLETSPEDSLQSFRSWIQKIEQSTTSVSSRLTAVERRLSGRLEESIGLNQGSMQGPIETLIRNGKKGNAGELAHVLDWELTQLHNEMVKQEQDWLSLQNQMGTIEKKHNSFASEIHLMHTAVTHANERLETLEKRHEHHEPFMMRFGTMEIPIEFSGVIGGFLAFLIAALVVFGQKEVLLSPIFLSSVGVLLIGFSLIKMIRTRSKTHPVYAMPLVKQTSQLDTTQYEQKKG